ncbi:hypothetical protein PFNF54_01763 [Plasmodium falciparum NF54]|uniref:Erythrocyte membrane protein 1 n=1 Tax=Plasmodium falciparum (isolate NF54) TaxID=5843 RepID=W7JX06_PLAFO|nr:hypothetical protein PFNF54_01763 [Plasmodium falciparum NF54]
MLDEELNDAKQCIEKHTCPPQEGLARSESDTQRDTHSDDVEAEEEDEEEEEDDVGAEGESETVKDTEAPVETKKDVDVCKIVEQALNNMENLNAACTLKYGPKAPTSWKCIPSGSDSSSSGAICVPPRRRRLYVGKLEQWANKHNTDASEARGSEAPSPSGTDTHTQPDPQKALLKAFVESAAVETFFLWHRYKEEKKKPQEGGLPLLGTGDSVDGEEEEQPPQNELNGGKIPNDFLRQMFYTLADYKDILDGKNIVADILNGSSGSDKDMVEREKTIKEKIKIFFEQNGNKEAAPRGSTQTQPSEKLKSWWSQNGEYIWKGMVCALTYEENGARGTDGKTTLKRNDDVYEKFFGKPSDSSILPVTGSTPTGTAATPNGTTGTYTTQYQYDSVTIGASGTGAKSDDTINNPTLKDFVLRPPYFRYLEEWGETFCRQRTRMLEKIKDDCKVGQGNGKNGDKVCSGYGEECKIEDISKEGLFADLKCPSCAISCSSYRKWIKGKKTQYEKQKDRYKTEIDQAKSDNEFCATLKSLSDAAQFLERLGPCKKDNASGEGKKFFENEGEAFTPATNCKPCPEFKINCKNGKCKSGDGDTKEKCNEKTTIDVNDIENKTDVNNIVMLVSDDNKNKSETVLEACIEAGIFKGIRKEEWKCRNECGLDVCGLKKGDNNGKLDDKQIILIRALIKRWLEYFLEDYNKIRKKLKSCTEKGEGSPCIKDCKKKCDCVKAWINLKTKEWEEIKKPYLEQYKNGYGENYNVKTILEKFQDQPEFKKAIGPCPNLGQFEDSIHCNGAARSENGKKRDIVECLLQKLEKKAEKCQNQNETACDTPSTCDKNLTPDVEDDDEEPYEDLLLQETEEKPEEAKKKMMPKICEGVIPKEEVKDKDGCKPAAAPSAETDKEKPVPKPPSQPTNPPNPFEHPAVIPALMSSTIMWSVGIGFAAFTYFYLKKKTKASVGNLFQILQIPKGDYDIPTLKSSNRYIPYASDRYKGKTYIYMEGDSSGDEKYAFMSDTTDVTSSESEYEELDINDIYVPGSPKYKTLIEVVLEPSKRDTMSTQSDIPLNDKLDSNKLTDEEWNKLKQDFISILQNPQNDLPQNNISGNIQMDTHPSVSILHDDMEEKPFITSIHDRDLHNGEEVTYNINLDDHKNMNFSTNHDNIPPKNNQNDLYTGIDLINDSISGNHNVDIYDEVLKRKENELFGTNHTKHTTTNSITKKTHNDPIVNQINLFHKWLDRHKNMCEQWDKHKKEELLDKLKKEWEQDYNNNSDDIHTSDNNIVSTVNHVFNTDVSIQIDMDDPNPVNPFTNMYTNSDNSTMDNILNGMEKHREPYFYDIYEDDITYFDIDDEKTPMGDIYVDHNNVNSNNMDVPNKVHIEMNIVNNKKEIFEEEYPISDIWNI